MIEKLASIDQTMGLNDRIYSALKEAVLQKVLVPGQRLDISELADHWNVSRTPVNDALQRLMVEGLVEVVPRKGTFVSKVHAADVLNMLDVRLMFELFAAEKISQTVIGAQIAELEKVVQQGDHMLLESEMNYVAYTNLDISFHSMYVEWTGNSNLIQLYKAQNFHWQTTRLYYNHEQKKIVEGQREHWNIVYAFAERDLDNLRKAINQHINSAKEGIHKLIEQGFAN